MTRMDLWALAAIALTVLTMPIYAIAARGRETDADVRGRPKTVLLGFWVRDWLMWVITPAIDLSVRLQISPLIFNLAGVVFGLASGLAFARGALPLGGWCVLLGGLADVFDGRIARARSMTSRSGAFLDSTLDRFAETFAYAGLAVYYAASPWRAAGTALALGGSLLVSYSRARGEALGVQCRGGIMQRAERLVLLALASIVDPGVTSAAHWPSGHLLSIAIAAIAIGSIGTAIYRTASIAGALDAADRTPPQP